MTRTMVKFGVFVAICLGFTLWLAFTIGNVRLFESRYELTAAFDDVTGLLIVDNVKISGVVVGKVTGIKVEDGRARVTFEVQDKYELRDDTTASIRWRNLIGQRYLYLQPGTEGTTMLEGGSEISDTKSAIDLGKLFNSLGPIVEAVDPDQVNAFRDTITAALDGTEDKVSQAIDDLAVFARVLGERDTTIGRLITNLDTVAGTLTARDQQIRTLLDNLVSLAQTFSDNTAIVDEALTELGSFSTSLDNLLTTDQAEIDRLITNLDVVVSEVCGRPGGAADEGDTCPRLLQLKRVLDHLPVATRALFQASRLGEWLNQSILCAATAPPTGVPPCLGFTGGEPGPNTEGAAAAGARSTVDLDPTADLGALVTMLTGDAG